METRRYLAKMGFANSVGAAPPVGQCSHIADVPPGTTTLYIADQLPWDEPKNVRYPGGALAQARVVLEGLESVLEDGAGVPSRYRPSPLLRSRRVRLRSGAIASLRALRSYRKNLLMGLRYVVQLVWSPKTGLSS